VNSSGSDSSLDKVETGEARAAWGGQLEFILTCVGYVILMVIFGSFSLFTSDPQVRGQTSEVRARWKPGIPSCMGLGARILSKVL